MGNKHGNSKRTKELKEADIRILLDHTSFNRQQIIDWHKGFLVSKSNNVFEFSSC
jgi:hypothetical protein